MSELLGTITRNMAPLYKEDAAAKVSKLFSVFIGQNGHIRVDDDASEVEYEVQKDRRYTATMVKRAAFIDTKLGTAHKYLEPDGYTSVARAYPLSVEEFAIDSRKLRDKCFGEPRSNPWTRQKRAMYHAAVGFNYALKGQANLIDWLASKSVLEGKQPAIVAASVPADYEYDMYRNASLNITLGGAAIWGTNPTSCKPLDDIDTAITTSIGVDGWAQDMGLFGRTAFRTMVESTQVKTVGDNMAFTHFVRVGKDGMQAPAKFSKLQAAGWDYQGMLRTLNGREIHCFTSDVIRQNPVTGSDEAAMPLTKVILGSVDARVDGMFGGPETLPETSRRQAMYRDWFGINPNQVPSRKAPESISGVLRPEMFFLDAVENEKYTALVCRSQTAPIIVTTATNAWVVIENAGA